MFEVGDRIDDVEIVARLRAGGMAALYLGRRVGAGGFSKEVAIKVIHGHLSGDQSFVEMFVDEARLSARIDHPNVVRVEALKEHGGSYCLLMEFVHGCSLSQLMAALKKREQRFSPELAVALAIRIADGLHAAHELLNPDGTAAGVVHRDVSPANILVGYRGDVKLIDFGIAKATQRLHQTEAAGLKGKIAYMSPEQAFGREVDRRTDVYALAIVLWEMLAMRRLFTADNDLRLLDMVREPKVLPPGALVPDLPPALDRVILDALAPDKDRRPASARDLRYRLLDALPSAAAIDPLQISAVVCDVMADKIQEDREILSLSSFNAIPHPSDKESVTVSRLLRSVGTDVEVALDELGHSAQELAGGYHAAQARDAPPTVLPHDMRELMTPTSAPRRKRGLLPLVIGAAAGLGLAAGGAAGLIYAFVGQDDPVDTVALPDDAEEQPESIAAPPPTQVVEAAPPTAPVAPVAAAAAATAEPVAAEAAEVDRAPEAIRAQEAAASEAREAAARSRRQGRRRVRRTEEARAPATTAPSGRPPRDGPTRIITGEPF